MKQLRLLAIIEAYSITGPAKNLLTFARLAAPEGVETRIITFNREAASNVFIDTCKAQGVAIDVVPERGSFDLAARRHLRRIVEAHRPDILQTHAVKSHFLARSVGLPELAPWVAFHHGYTWPTLKARLYNQLDRWSLRTARQVLTVSGPFREELAQRGVARERVEIIHNSIQPQWGQQGRQPAAAAALRGQLQIPADRPVILIVGRLSREKDHISLVEAVHTLTRRAHLVMVGDGPERPRIEATIRRLGMQDQVTFTGQQKSAEQYYGIADVAVLASLSEGSPNALLEAMAAGVPTVATRVGGIPEIVSHEDSALLVTPGDVAALGSSMERLLTDPELAARLVNKSQELIRLRHSPESRMRRLVEIYRGLAA